MKTKLYISMAALALGMGVTTSCSDFLEEENKVGETADLTYSTKTGIDGLVANCYSFARGWYGKEAGLGLSEMGTDLFCYGFDNKQKSLNQYTFTSAALDNNVNDNSSLDHYWEMFYCAADVCNNAIVQVGKSTVLSESEKQQYLGEAYFLRAFYYFHMVNIWGAVPYNDAPIKSQNLNPIRMSEEMVYGKILADLDTSIKEFEAADYKTKAKGRANYWAARALKARVLIYAASWLNGQLGKQVAGNDSYAAMNGTQLYAAAQAEAEAVMGATGYASLYSNYNDVWSMDNEAYENNHEALFGITYSDQITSNVNCIPYRYKNDESGKPLNYNSLITRTGYTRGGSAMLLMFVSKWNNGCNDLGGNGQKETQVFWRVAAGKTTIKSAATKKDIEVGAAYSPYGRGFCRYVPSMRLWQLLEEHRATDQRTEATLLDHYDIASPDLAGNARNYPLLKDTAIYYCPLDGNSAEGKAKQAWAKNRYRIQFISGGDIPVFSSNDPAVAKPTEAAKPTSDVYGDKRYNSVAIGGWQSYPGIKKFLDNVYNPTFPTWDISSRDAIVMRLPEMYLIKAEAQLAQGDATGALATINQLRAVRAKDGADNSLSRTPTIDTILNERAIEFCGEQMRWFDLKRTGKLHEYVIKYNAQASPQLKADSNKHFLYRPIPQNELDAVQNLTTEVNSTTGFWQNPGW
ncbi:MAG: RagB/SusD family nutrient uptake outer membrane protein [Prevotella buccae]|uniref:RagB/SusD family nutrient uptake outer membrane protein n=3 Tax=Segatella buccae TaxID=28126 RepID=UPI00243087D1|nr:RagB/SusD family nutrient uptake outer membrane protein [Segatella buccae]MBS5894269.1 RagB/SusD family nutrient uptake outer membrane protein [Segatella buccae]